MAAGMQSGCHNLYSMPCCICRKLDAERPRAIAARTHATLQNCWGGRLQCYRQALAGGTACAGTATQLKLLALLNQLHAEHSLHAAPLTGQGL